MTGEWKNLPRDVEHEGYIGVGAGLEGNVNPVNVIDCISNSPAESK